MFFFSFNFHLTQRGAYVHACFFTQQGGAGNWGSFENQIEENLVYCFQSVFLPCINTNPYLSSMTLILNSVCAERILVSPCDFNKTRILPKSFWVSVSMCANGCVFIKQACTSQQRQGYSKLVMRKDCHAVFEHDSSRTKNLLQWFIQYIFLSSS